MDSIHESFILINVKLLVDFHQVGVDFSGFSLNSLWAERHVSLQEKHSPISLPLLWLPVKCNG